MRETCSFIQFLYFLYFTNARIYRFFQSIYINKKLNSWNVRKIFASHHIAVAAISHHERTIKSCVCVPARVSWDRMSECKVSINCLSLSKVKTRDIGSKKKEILHEILFFFCIFFFFFFCWWENYERASPGAATNAQQPQEKLQHSIYISHI